MTSEFLETESNILIPHVTQRHFEFADVFFYVTVILIKNIHVLKNKSNRFQIEMTEPFLICACFHYLWKSPEQSQSLKYNSFRYTPKMIPC